MVFFISIISGVNLFLLRLGRFFSFIALGLMVFVILLQVFCRYVLGDALAWPDEAARFLMLWMVGLSAPSAYRAGGFVAIDMFPSALPPGVGRILNLVLFIFSAFVLVFAIRFGWDHTMGFGGKFDSSSLTLPFDWIGGESVRVKLRYMYGSLLVGMVLVFLVNLELILRSLTPSSSGVEIFAGETEVAGGD